MARPEKLPRGISLHGDRYRVRVSVEGKLHSLGVFDTLGDAKAAQTIAKAEKVRGTFVAPSQLREERKAAIAQAERESVTLAQWVDQWLEHLRDHGGAESSIVTHRSAMRVHVLPVLGERRLVDISPEDVDELIAGVRARPSKRNPKARANGVAPNVLRTLRACMNVAVKKGLLVVSPVRAEAPARRVRPVDPEGDVATPEEVAAMTAAMPDRVRRRWPPTDHPSWPPSQLAQHRRPGPQRALTCGACVSDCASGTGECQHGEPSVRSGARTGRTHQRSAGTGYRPGPVP